MRASSFAGRGPGAAWPGAGAGTAVEMAWSKRYMAFLLGAQQRGRMAGQHAVLVGGNHAHGDPALAVRYQGGAAAIAVGVEADAHPLHVAANAGADHVRVLADAAGENQRVEAAERGGHGGDELLRL